MKISLDELNGGGENVVRVTPADNMSVTSAAPKLSLAELDKELPAEPSAARMDEVGGWASRRQAAPNDWSMYGGTDYGPGKVAATAAGTVGQLVDMTLSGIEQFITMPRRQSTMLRSIEEGNSDAVTETAREAAGQIFPPEISRPFSIIAERLGASSKKAYEENPLGFISSVFGNNIEHGASVISEATGIKTPVIREAVDSIMGFLAAKAVKGGWEALNEAKKSQFADEFLSRYKQRVEEVRVTPADNKGGEIDVNNVEQVKAMFAASQEARQAAEILKQVEAEKANRKVKVPGEEQALPPDLDAALTKVSKGEEASLTEKEQAALDDVRKNSPLVDTEGKPLQRGAIHPELVKLLATFTAGAAISAPGIFAIVKYLKDENRKRNEKDEEDWYKGRIFKNIAQDTTPLMLAAGAFGTIRSKGTGSWHMEVPAKLAASLVERLREAPHRDAYGVDGALPEGIKAKNESVENWATRAVRNHLNKHMGTSTDPLKDVEIPSQLHEGGTATWEQLVDASVESRTIAAVEKELAAEGKASPYGKAPKHELVYDFEDTTQSFEDIKSYLSHVGDYLRENVPADKLPNYDLVRAVKETKKWDEEMAKKMEKTAKESSAKMPVYKDYGDGYKWVEVKGKTPEETKAALQHEGDSMGHCVGGYCDYVELGDSKIYSLRDAKGKSHVTIEVKPKGPGSRLSRVVGDKLAQKGAEILGVPDDIIQIKGKQNRAPIAEYLPYVQDFVKGGKWGEVGDVDNASMSKVSHFNEATQTAIHKLYGEDVKYVTNAEADKAIDTIPAKDFFGKNNQRGSVDPKLLAGLAAIGGGALIDDKNPLRGAILGGLGAALLIRKGKLPTDADRILGQISTTLRGFDPAIERRARDLVLSSGQRLHKAATEIQPFLEKVGDLSKPVQEVVNQALVNGDWETVKKLPGFKAPAEAVQKVLAGYKETLQGLGRFGEGVSDYFPRLIKDFDGLKKTLNQESLKGLEKTLLEAEGEMLQKRHRGLTEVERSIVTNRFLFSDGSSSFLPNYAKGRKIQYVTPELMKFYETPANSLKRYLTGAVFDIETAKFFGRDLKTTASGNKKFTDVDGSIGNLVQGLVKEGKIDQPGVTRLTEVLNTFFNEGQKAPEAYLQDIRNYTNLGLLSDVASATTQIADPLMVFAYHGFGPTLKGLIQNIRGPEIRVSDLGLSNKIVEELSSERFSGRVLHTVLKPIFSQIDLFGKQMNVSAALIKNRDLVKTKGGMELFQRKWGAYFGEDFPALVEDLRTKQLTPRIDSLLFGELADVQPTSMLEMPEAYAKNPKLRLAWQMKSWMLKQGDVVRREVVQNIASGDPARMKDGGKMLLKLGAAYALSNVPSDTIKDWMAGRPIHPVDSGKLLENVGQAFGFNRFALDQLEKGDLRGAVGNAVLPAAFSMAEPIFKNQYEKLANYIPVFGREAYARLLGGNERRELSEAAQADKAKKEELHLKSWERLPTSEKKEISEAAKEFRRKQREAKRSQQ